MELGCFARKWIGLFLKERERDALRCERTQTTERKEKKLVCVGLGCDMHIAQNNTVSKRWQTFQLNVINSGLFSDCLTTVKIYKV